MVQILKSRGRLSRNRTEAALVVSIALFLILVLMGRSCSREGDEFAFVEAAEASQSPAAERLDAAALPPPAAVSSFDSLCLDRCDWRTRQRPTPAAAKKFVAPSDFAGLAESPISIAAALSADDSPIPGQPAAGGPGLRAVPGGLSGFISIGLVPGPGGSGGGGGGGDGGGGGESPPGDPGGGDDPIVLDPEDPQTPIETPLPGSIYLFGSALAGLAFAMRSRKK